MYKVNLQDHLAIEKLRNLLSNIDNKELIDAINEVFVGYLASTHADDRESREQNTFAIINLLEFLRDLREIEFNPFAKSIENPESHE